MWMYFNYSLISTLDIKLNNSLLHNKQYHNRHFQSNKGAQFENLGELVKNTIFVA